MFGAVRNALVQGGRALVQPKKVFTNSVARSSGHHDEVPAPGSNLPFDINNKYKLTLYFILFVSSGLAIPFIAVRHQLKKQ